MNPSDILLYLQILIVLSLSTLLIITLSNLRYLRHLPAYPPITVYPRFSVLVPARNEEQNIGNCVRGLLAQDYPDFQVIILDDNSTDRTWEILQQFANNDGRLKLLKGTPLPEDWLGKHWACHQLAEASDGEYLLFADADTVHEPGMLKQSASAMVTEKADLISALPFQSVVSWSEKLTIPAFYMGLLCGVPLELTKLTRNPLLFAALGQFMIFSRKAYQATGGYAAVKQNIVDDIAIGRRVHAMGMRYRLIDGCGGVSCRMYRGLEQTWKGLTKSTFATFNFDPVLLLLMYLLVIMVLVEPPVLLLISLFSPIQQLTVIITVLAVLLSLLLFAVCYRRFRFPLYLVFVYPASAVFMTVIAFASMVLTLQGKALWKGRSMPKSVKL